MINTNTHKTKENKMKKFNATKITEILNNRMAAGLGHGHYHAKGFEVISANHVGIFDFDRGSRRDSEHMSEIDFDKEVSRFEKQYTNTLGLIKLTLKNAKYACTVNFDQDEKGWCFIDITPAPNSKIAKDSRKKLILPAAKGVIATIRTAITDNRLTKDQILEIMVADFPERESAKMAKTIAAQLPSRIVKGTDLKVTKTDKGYKIEKK